MERKNFQCDFDHLPPQRMHDVHVSVVGMYAFRKVICFYTVRMHLVTIMARLAVSLPHNGWPPGGGQREAYHGRPTLGKPERHRGSLGQACSAVSFNGSLGRGFGRM